MSVWCLVSGVAPYNISILAAWFFCQAFEQFKEAINEDLLKDAPATGFAATLVFRATVENAVKHIINIHPARKTNHLICGSDEGIKDAHKPGALGLSSHFTYVVENNGRGSSHIHALHGAGASPRLLADIASYPQLRDRALAAIETQLVASLPLLVGIALRC